MIDIIGCLVMENLEEPGIHLLDPTSEEVWQALEKTTDSSHSVYCHWSNVLPSPFRTGMKVMTHVRESFTTKQVKSKVLL